MRKVLAAAGWVNGFMAVDLLADRYGLSVTKLSQGFRREVGPLAFDLLLAGAALGYRNHLKRGM
ncbi:MAG TPA: hypothetical protein VJW23_10240 [Propionibacteriaceae bacterium]|nr:hypothetical protein [Propionibacteriaceae bacterium]